ncbi:cell surface immobilization antigen (macronuclear) [Tetrahymena thermophila SB210]|uniref:Cell surface immobilization antigen n=1 Tax=Tetrahymena thermophila (strain SB210) TaxID=312017 RepID=Q235T1_TETTS|nr:cell surface immobilization antigen [Tetrahymena thermophila SB210]EAR92275.2 cell surface immobilization antigen [Tetrahymena thermophila SB210]|eukprot:XP_001012520.2 cell surface immobilization antigen [Tetrahymena thermophila SB210]
MNILKLLIASLLVSQIFAVQGADVICNYNTCTTLGTCTHPPSNFAYWLELIEWFKPANTWNDLDWLACYGSSRQYANLDSSDCQTNPPGTSVICSTETCTTPGTCTDIPTAPATLTWQNGNCCGKFAITSCPEDSSQGLIGASDLFCHSCPGINSNSNIIAWYANTALTDCVAASATFGNTRTANTWTNKDYLVCNETSTQYDKAYKSGCQATAPSSTSSPSPSFYSNSMIILSSILFLISYLF